MFLKNSKINFHLIFITDDSPITKLKGTIEQSCKAGVKAIQLRQKTLTTNEILQTARIIKEITTEFNSQLLINDRLDIALLSKADGLHSPENGIMPSQSKKFNSQLICGKSVHSVRNAKIAEKQGYDYIIYGPVFKTPSKIKYGKPQGLEALKRVCKSVDIPVFAVGGITALRAKKCISSGAFGVAVISAIMCSNNVKNIVTEFDNALGGL